MQFLSNFMLAIFISSCSSSPRKIFWGRRRDGIVSYHYFCYYCCILIDVDLSSFIFSNLFLPAIFCPPKIMLKLNCKQNRNSACMARRISSCPEIALHSFLCLCNSDETIWNNEWCQNGLLWSRGNEVQFSLLFSPPSHLLMCLGRQLSIIVCDLRKQQQKKIQNSLEISRVQTRISTSQFVVNLCPCN